MQSVRTRFDFGAVAAAVGLLIATGGPSIWLTNRTTHVGYDIEAWPFLYPYVWVAVIGIVGLSRLRLDRDRVPWAGILAVGFYVTWALLSVTWSVAPFYTT